MKPAKAKHYRMCDYCRRVGLLGFVRNPTPGWLFESVWMCKNTKACAERVAKNKKEMMEFNNVYYLEDKEPVGEEQEG